MDSNECAKRIDSALSDGHTEEAFLAAGDLLSWLRRGGFPPDVEGIQLILLGIRNLHLSIVADALSSDPGN